MVSPLRFVDSEGGFFVMEEEGFEGLREGAGITEEGEGGGGEVIEEGGCDFVGIVRGFEEDTFVFVEEVSVMAEAVRQGCCLVIMFFWIHDGHRLGSQGFLMSYSSGVYLSLV